MRVSLISPPTQMLELSFPMKPRVQLGIGYIGTYLKNAGYDVNILDAEAEKLNLEELKKTLSKEDADVYGITCNTHTRFLVFKIAKMIKEHNKDVVVAVGGSHTLGTAKDILRAVPDIDVVVSREGELTMLDLVQSVEKGTEWKNIKGIAFRNNGDIVQTELREFLNMDTLPIMDRTLFKLEKYEGVMFGVPKSVKIKPTNFMCSRGCPMQCSFCNNQTFWRRIVRMRKPEVVVDEMEFLQNQFGYNAISIYDDTFNINPVWTTKICEEILKRKLSIYWYCTARVDKCTADLLKLMKRAGCVSIGFGFESGVQRILDSIPKFTTVQQMLDATKMCVDLDIKVKSFFMCNLPNETMEDVKGTLKFMDKLRRFGPQVVVPDVPANSVIYPGTDLERLAKQNGKLPKDFNWALPYYNKRNKWVREDPQVPLYEQIDLKKMAALLWKTKLMNYTRRKIRNTLLGESR